MKFLILFAVILLSVGLIESSPDPKFDDVLRDAQSYMVNSLRSSQSQIDDYTQTAKAKPIAFLSNYKNLKTRLFSADQGYLAYKAIFEIKNRERILAYENAQTSFDEYKPVSPAFSTNSRTSDGASGKEEHGKRKIGKFLGRLNPNY